MAQGLGLARRIDDSVKLLKIHKPYHESDHVLNIAFNAFCGGRTLEDIELRRNDAAYLDALGVPAIGYGVPKSLKNRAQAQAFSALQRRAKQAFVEADQRRARPPRHKESYIRAKGYKNIRLKSEDIAEFAWRPGACKQTYRMVVLRKNLSIERGENVLLEDVRYFLYITNDPDMTAAEVVFTNNDRCNQENLIEQLKNGVRALHAPVNDLNANWAYMVMASLAWSLKAWMALLLPISPRWRAKHEAERRACVPANRLTTRAPFHTSNLELTP